MAKMVYEKRIMCEYCIMGDSSHGEEIFVGNIVPEWEGQKCYSCGENGDDNCSLHNVIVEVFEHEGGED